MCNKEILHCALTNIYMCLSMMEIADTMQRKLDHSEGEGKSNDHLKTFHDSSLHYVVNINIFLSCPLSLIFRLLFQFQCHSNYHKTILRAILHTHNWLNFYRSSCPMTKLSLLQN